MPETDFYLCETDILEIGKLLFNQGARIIPDRDYPTPELLEISDLKELKRILHDSSSRLLFVVSPKWQRSPLEIQSVVKDHRQISFISQKNGGPTLDIFCPQPLVIDGYRAIPAGFIGYHDCFWNPVTSQIEPAPQVLIETYRVVRSYLARGARKVIRRHRRLLVTKNSLDSGLRLIDLKKQVGEKPRFVDLNELE